MDAATGWAARERLWQRLLNGELTEVYGIAGYGFASSSMGLEPISVCAYQYEVGNGELISNERREEIARELSAQPFWYVCSEHVPARVPMNLMAWDRHFIARAQVALIVLKTKQGGLFYRRARTVLPRRKAQESDFLAGGEPDPAVTEFYRELSKRPSSREPLPYGIRVARYLLDKCPDKTLIVSHPQDVRQLADLRIPRER
jgi:hypothetical protein